MLILAADTSTPLASAALLENGELLGQLQLKLGKGNADNLLPMIQALLRLAGRELGEVKLLCAGLGPGSFTGVRIGVVTLRMLAFALEIPAVGVSTLEALCGRWMEEPRLLAPLLDARKGEVYWALFRSGQGRLQRLEPDAVLPPAEVGARLAAHAEAESILTLGSGYDRYASEFRRGVPGVEVNAADLGRVALALHGAAGQDRGLLVPSYVRGSEAERTWAAKQLAGAKG